MTNRFEVAIVARDEFTKPLTAFTKKTREAFGQAGKSAGAAGKAWRQVGQDIEDAIEIDRRPEPSRDTLKGRPGSGAIPRFNSAVPRAIVDGADAAGLLGRGGASGFLGALAGGSLLGAGVAGVGALSNAMDRNVTTARALRMYGLSPHVAQEWLGAAQLANYSRDSMMNTLTGMAQTMYGVQNRPNEYVRQRMVLQKLGIDERSRPEHVMASLSRILPDLNPGVRRTIGAELGIDNDSLDFLSQGRPFVLDSLLKAKTKPGMILSGEELDNAERAGRTRAGVATDVQGKVNEASGWLTDLLRSREERKRDAEASWERSEQRDKAPAASGEDPLAAATRQLDIWFHGLPPGVTATAKPRGDTPSPRISTNRAGGTP